VLRGGRSIFLLNGKKTAAGKHPACIAGLWTAPLPAQSSPASQQSGDGQLQVERDFLAGQPAISRLLRGGR